MLTPPTGVTVVLLVVPELIVVDLYRLAGEAVAEKSTRRMLTDTSAVAVASGEALSVAVTRNIAVLVSPLVKLVASNAVVAELAAVAVMVPPETLVHA